MSLVFMPSFPTLNRCFWFSPFPFPLISFFYYYYYYYYYLFFLSFSPPLFIDCTLDPQVLVNTAVAVQWTGHDNGATQVRLLLVNGTLSTPFQVYAAGYDDLSRILDVVVPNTVSRTS